MIPTLSDLRELTPKVAASWRDGVIAAVLVSPGAHGFNRIFVAVSGFRPEAIAKMPFPSVKAARHIYRGIFDNPSNPGKPSLRNFVIPGYDSYIGREGFRCLFKPIGAQLVLPKLEKYYDVENQPKNKDIVANIFAAGMAVSDAPLGIIDSMRTRRQNGMPRIPTLKEAEGRNRFLMLTQGTGFNILRQGVIWKVWYETKATTQKWTREFFHLDPEKPSGLCTQSLLQSPPITLASIVFERLKNFVQLNPNAHVGRGNLYIVAIQDVINTRAFAGAIPKTCSIFFLVIGFNGLGVLANTRKTSQS